MTRRLLHLLRCEIVGGLRCRSRVREVDLPGLSLRQLVANQEATCQIVEHGLRRNSEFRRHALNRKVAIGPAQGIRADTVDLDGRDAPAGAQQPDILALEGAAR
jgi:hypothetical protein